jgi:hypothetical protein
MYPRKKANHVHSWVGIVRQEVVGESERRQGGGPRRTSISSLHPTTVTSRVVTYGVTWPNHLFSPRERGENRLRFMKAQQRLDQ